MRTLCGDSRSLTLATLVLCGLLLGCNAQPPAAPPRPASSCAPNLAAAETREERFYALGDAAKTSFIEGDVETARANAEELLSLLPGFRGNWNYGNAVQDANLVLGRVAVHEGRIDDAKRFLLAAGRSPGSPQLESFGPNMSLAKDLLDRGEKEVVLEYLALCRSFWTLDYGSLARWTREIEAGKTPDFGANLVY